MNFRKSLLLPLALISASAQTPFTQKGFPEGLVIRENNVPAALKRSAPSPAIKPQQTPEQLRSKMLQSLQIDRTPSGILTARLAARLTEKKQTDTPPAATPSTDPKSDARAKTAAYKRAFEKFRSDVTLGNWDEVKSYLADLPDNDAATAFSSLVTRLNAPVMVRPRKEIAGLGAKQHNQTQYLRLREFFALTDAAKKAPNPKTLQQLAGLIKGDKKPTADFFKTLEKGNRYFGSSEENKARTARLLIEAGHLEEITPFLPNEEQALEKKDHSLLNLLGRYHAESYTADRGKEHLPKAWELSLGIIRAKAAPINDRTEALYRALSLVPNLDDGTGKKWLSKTFSNASTEGFEILATVGTLTAQTREVRSADFRLDQLKLQSAAVAALTGTPEIDLTPWQEILTLYVLNWNAEAERSYRLDASNSLRPKSNVDSYGNIFYSRYQQPTSQASQRTTPAIPSGELLHTRPNDEWLAQIDPPVRLDTLAHTARLFLKVKEGAQAFPILKKLTAARPAETAELIREMIRVWGENHNPNQTSRYRSSYSYYSGYNQRAETIPLTRSKQERNLKLLATMVTEVKALGLQENFQEDFADAFIQAHSQAEVWRVELLASVFGETAKLDPKTIIALLHRMRGNLAGLWPDPKVQEKAKTKRKDKELEAQILKGYSAAKNLCLDALQQHPDNWALNLQFASLKYEESNYKAGITSHPEHTTTKVLALEDLAAAAQSYIATLPLDDQKEESTDAFTTWFYAALGSPDLAALKAEHQPISGEYPKIKAALESIPEPARKRHLDDFAKTLNARLANVSADLKYRFLESAIQITGEHQRIEEAAKVFQYYKDLVTEIQLNVYLDGPDRINASEPFGLFVNLNHTKEIERESGGFQRYLINQNNTPYAYNYGRPTEDYRDKFEKNARGVLEEHFEIVSLTFHNSKVASRTNTQEGWTTTPYAYFLLKPKGPEIDVIPPLKIDLDFLDTSGYVVLPIISPAIPIDASQEAPARPIRDLSLSMTLDQREAEKEGTIALEIRASGHGLVPSLHHLIELPIDGFKIASTDDRELQIDELDARSEDGSPISTHEWRLILEADGNKLPSQFTFPKVLAELSSQEGKGLTLQKYEDVDLVTVEETTKIMAGSDAPSPWLWLTPLVLIGALIAFFRLRKKAPVKIVEDGPALPTTLTPVTVLAFLETLQSDPRLPADSQADLSKSIRSLQDRAFGSDQNVPDTDELHEIANRSIQTLQKAS